MRMREVQPVQHDTLEKYQAFDNQIGGHLKIKGITCMVADKHGHLLKYVEKSNVGETEEAFYSIVFSDLRFVNFRKFMPQYFGTIVCGNKGNFLRYLKIENAIHNFENPNIVDIKIGKVTHDPFAKEEKITREYEKYPAQRDIGFRLSGMKVYSIQNTSYEYCSGRMFRTCTCYASPQEKTLNYLEAYFGLHALSSYDAKPNGYVCESCNILRTITVKKLIDNMIKDLHELITYMETESKIKLYSSSILLAYDSTAFDSLSHCTRHSVVQPNSAMSSPVKVMDSKLEHNCQDVKEMKERGHCKVTQVCPEEECTKPILSQYTQTLGNHVYDKLSRSVPYTLKMIDFGHTYVELNMTDGVDSNYLFGVYSLLDYFQLIQKSI